MRHARDRDRGLEVVADRPGRGDAVVVMQLTEVLLTQAVERRAVQLVAPPTK